jgi:hypothetical protein
MKRLTSALPGNRFNQYTDAQRLAFLRIAVGAYALLFLVIRSLHLWNAANYSPSRWESIGILVPLTSAPAPWIFRMLLLASILSGIGFVLGWRYRITGPLFAVLFLLITTFRFSWGSVLHTEHLVVIHVFIIGFAAADHAWTYRSLSNTQSESIKKDTYTWAIHVCAVATVVGYTVSGVAKIRYGGWDWLSGDVLRNQIAFDNLRKIKLGDIRSPFASWIVNNSAPLKIFAPITVMFELAAPLALFHELIRKIWVIGIWLFHLAVLLLMAIVFPYQLLTIAYLPVMLMTPIFHQSSQRSAPLRDNEQHVQQHETLTSN